MASFDIQIGYDDPDEIRALYQGLLAAAATERTERNRLGKLITSGYSNRLVAGEYERATKRADALGTLAADARERMRLADIEPW